MSLKKKERSSSPKVKMVMSTRDVRMTWDLGNVLRKFFTFSLMLLWERHLIWLSRERR